MSAVRKAYSRSWFYLRWYKLIYVFPISYFFKSVLFLALMSLSSSILNWLAIALNFALGVVLELALIFLVLDYKEMLPANVSIRQLIQKYFLRACGINIASIFWTLLLLSPFCFFFYLVVLAELNNFVAVLAIVGYLGYCIFSFGIRDLGIRIMISEDIKARESMWRGFRELNIHLSHYLLFVLVSTTLVSLPLFLMPLLIPPVSLNDISEFLAAFVMSYSFSFITYIILPLNIATKTFIYLDRKSQTIISTPQIDTLKVQS